MDPDETLRRIRQQNDEDGMKFCLGMAAVALLILALCTVLALYA